MDGAQANNGAGTGSAGTGTATVQYDDATGLLSWSIEWQNLGGTPTLMHFHGPAAPGVSAGVQVNIGVASNPAVGTAAISAAQATDLLAGLWYVNLHTSTFGGGEIRGQVLPAPGTFNYWPLNETAGSTAPNDAFGGADASLFNGATWVSDAERGQVLEFDGVDGYADAGMLPTLEPTAADNFAWTFWAKSAQGANNNVILGNRYPNEGWIKFTTSAFEFRDSVSINSTINYADITGDEWIHHAVSKRGQLLTYYRNGFAAGSNWVVSSLPAPPLYFGGDMTNENWAGRLDEITTWREEVTSGAISAIARGASPVLVRSNPTVFQTVLSDDFSSGLGQWTVTNRGLEQNAAAGYNAPDTSGDQLTLGGTTTGQYWFGSSVESALFDARLPSRVNVTRVSLTGSGTAYRSSVWIFGDDGHNLHFSQNIGENGWQFNARDDGGNGTLTPTGGGQNIAPLDALDGDGGSHDISLVLSPAGSGGLNVEMWVDGVIYRVHSFTNFPQSFRVILTGQGRAIGDSVAAVFDDFSVEQEDNPNLAPSFAPSSVLLPSGTEGVAYSQDLSAFASDPEDDELAYSIFMAPAWANVSPEGLLTGTPDDSQPIATVVVVATDVWGNSATGTFRLRVQFATGAPALFGWWPLKDGSGATAADISGNGRSASIINEATGGLGTLGESWITDPECGGVLSFNGDNATGSAATVNGSLPLLDAASSSFTWSVWTKSDQAADSRIILGNRYSSSGVDTVPREFVKLTQSQFEWHTNGNGENIDFDDIPQGVWVHNVIVKQGGALFYYRNGALLNARTISGSLQFANPIYFGGQNGIENWRGALSDVRMYESALSEAEILDVYANKGVLPQEDLRITSIARAGDGSVTITWNAAPGKTYRVDFSLDLETWTEAADQQDSSFTLPAGDPIVDPAMTDNLYLRVAEEP